MCSQCLCGAAVVSTWLSWRYRPSSGNDCEKTECLFWSKLKISSFPNSCMTRTELDCNIQTTGRFAPLILLQLVWCKSHAVLQVPAVCRFLLPVPWPRPPGVFWQCTFFSHSFHIHFVAECRKDRAGEKKFSLLSDPPPHTPPHPISFDFLGERTAPCLRVIWHSSCLCWISLCHSICLSHNPSLRSPELPHVNFFS